ncbi:MAG: hypothetical protein ACRYG5_17370 [Janthinobacterium lividum]
MVNDAKTPEHPEPAKHSDNEKSSLPERDDKNRQQGPNDSDGQKKNEEPSVG